MPAPLARTCVILLLVLFLVACGGADSASHDPPAASGGAKYVAEFPTPEGDAAESVNEPFFHRGANLAHIHRRGSGYGSDTAGRALDQLAEVGFNSIAITPFAYQKTHDAPVLAGFTGRPGDAGFFKGTDPSMTDEDVTRQIRQARDRGMRVMLKPHIWAGDFWKGEQWHGTVTQASARDHAQWWGAYRAFILHYATLAADAEAEGFCIGTELLTMTREYPDEWRALIRDVRDIFPGHVTYAAHWESEYEAIEFWDDLDSIGISSYFPLDAPAGGEPGGAGGGVGAVGTSGRRRP